MSGLFAKNVSPPSTPPATEPSEPVPVMMRDRALPMWSVAVSALFSLGSGICLLAIAIFFIFLFEEVAINGQILLAPLLATGAAVPIFGILIFETSHAKALAGLRYIRVRNAVAGRAIVGAVAGGIFAFLDPLLALPFVICAALSWLACRYSTRWMRGEPLWAFDPQEAVAFLSGRDRRAVELAQAERADGAFLIAALHCLALAALVGNTALASWLVATGRLNIASVVTIALVTYWSAQAFGAFFRQHSRADPEQQKRAQEVLLLPPPFSDDPASDEAALVVNQLSVRTSAGAALLSNISFRVEPGRIIGLTGDSFAGKSLLLQALQAPHDLEGLSVRGYVGMRGTPLWGRSGAHHQLQSVLIPPQLIAAPGSGAKNLTCFGDADQLSRARRALQGLVFTADTVERILSTQDVTTLATSEQKALALARALALRPPLYLLDRPEDGAGEALLRALGDRLRADVRHGHIALIATENRYLLDQCDQLLMMQNGRVIELAPTSEIRARQSSGWSRFTALRDLESEEALDGWICSHFRRDGDEANRRTICMVANEMLSVACQSSAVSPEGTDTLSFEFKHFAGRCEIRMIDARLSLSSGAVQKAKKAAATSVEGERLSPLAKIVRDSLTVETGHAEDGTGFLHVAVKTYDPRLLNKRKADPNASAKA